MPAMDLSQGKLFDNKDLEAAKKRRISLASNSSGKASEKVRVLGGQQQCGWIRVGLAFGFLNVCPRISRMQQVLGRGFSFVQVGRWWKLLATQGYK